MVSRRFTPFEELETLREQLNQVFEPVVRGVGDELRATFWTLPLELTETSTAYKLRAMIPGVDPDRIEVQATGRSLSIQAELTPPEIDKNDFVHLKEFRYGQLRRSLEFREPIVSGEIEANYQNGILTLNIPKEEAAQKKSVKVQVKANSPQ